MNKSKKVIQNNVSSGGGNMVYFFGLIGALVYYLQQANSFGEGVMGVLKAFVWPAFVIYELLKFFQIS